MNKPTSFSVLFLFIVLLIAIYQSSLAGSFIFDDFPNIFYNENLQQASFDSLQSLYRAIWSSTAGPLKRPVSMFSFALDHALHGMNPFYFRLTNLLIHALAGIGVFFFARNLLQAPLLKPGISRRAAFWLALIMATAWLVHPLQLTSVAYIVQRMTSLAGLFMFWGLAAYTHGRLHQLQGQAGLSWVFSAYLLFLPLAALSKENGVLLLPFAGP